jgi:hypothetical protein
MNYMYSETYDVKVSVKMTSSEIEALNRLAVKLLGDSDEAQAARTLVGMDSWDVRKLRDATAETMRKCAEALRYESESLGLRFKAEE